MTVDADQHAEARVIYGIETYPTIRFFVNGRMADEYEGKRLAADIVAAADTQAVAAQQARGGADERTSAVVELTASSFKAMTHDGSLNLLVLFYGAEGCGGAETALEREYEAVARTFEPFANVSVARINAQESRPAFPPRAAHGRGAKRRAPWPLPTVTSRAVPGPRRFPATFDERYRHLGLPAILFYGQARRRPHPAPRAPGAARAAHARARRRRTASSASSRAKWCTRTFVRPRPQALRAHPPAAARAQRPTCGARARGLSSTRARGARLRPGGSAARGPAGAAGAMVRFLNRKCGMRLSLARLPGISTARAHPPPLRPPRRAGTLP